MNRLARRQATGGTGTARQLRSTTRDSGATSVEYALMLVCIAVAIVGGATVLGTATAGWLLTPLVGF